MTRQLRHCPSPLVLQPPLIETLRKPQPPQILSVYQPFTVFQPFRLEHPKAQHETQTQCNELMPIEVLQIIFLLATRPSGDDINLNEKITLRTTIISCSQVCRTWRMASRGYSCLWVHAVDFQHRSLEVIDDRLRLSSPHFIDVGHRSAPVRLSLKHGPVILSILEDNIHRIREWNNVNLGHGASHQWACGSEAPPQLKTFRWTGAFVYSKSPPHRHIPSPHSKLRKLSLHSSNFPLSPSINLAHLTELSVCNQSTARRFSAAEWLNILRCTPHLQLLCIHNALSSGGRQLTPAEPHVDLPNLRLISLGDQSWMHAMLMVFLFIDPSPVCGVQLSLPNLPLLAGVDTLCAFFFRLADYFQDFVADHSNIPCLEMAIRPNAKTDRAVLGTVVSPETQLNWNGPGGTAHVLDHLSSSSSSTFPPFSVGIHDPSGGRFSMASALNGLLLPGASSLRITVDSPFTVVTQFPGLFSLAIPTTLKMMDSLTSLVLDESAILSVLPSIMGLIKAENVPATDPVSSHRHCRLVPYLPKLQYIVPQNVSFGKSSRPGAAFQMLLSYVGWRRAVGRPIQIWHFGFEGTAGDGEAMPTPSKRRGMIVLDSFTAF